MVAEIYAFPTEAPLHERPGTGTEDAGEFSQRPARVPDEVWRAVESIRTMQRVQGVRYREIPVHSELADFGIGIEMQCRTDAGGDGCSQGLPTVGERGAGDAVVGWMMALYSYTAPSESLSRWRCMAFARIPLKQSEHDATSAPMYWDAMCRCLIEVDPESVSGSVSITQDIPFGASAGPTGFGCELRASWLPAVSALDGLSGFDAAKQMGCWANFLKSNAEAEEDLQVER